MTKIKISPEEKQAHKLTIEFSKKLKELESIAKGIGSNLFLIQKGVKMVANVSSTPTKKGTSFLIIIKTEFPKV